MILAYWTKFNQIEEKCNQLQADNVALQGAVALASPEVSHVEIQGNFDQLKEENVLLKESLHKVNCELDSLKTKIDLIEISKSETAGGLSKEQSSVNCNIVIRGLDLSQDTPESDLKPVFENVCKHLGISDKPEFKPVSAALLGNTSGKINRFSKPLQVVLQTAEAKRQFLQVRRIKRDIYPIDIGVTQLNKQPLLICEKLTRSNQELLYQARSIRGPNGFKFVWSNNGQILVRRNEHTRVIRIIDTNHITQLKDQLNKNEQSDTGKPVQYATGNS